MRGCSARTASRRRRSSSAARAASACVSLGLSTCTDGVWALAVFEGACAGKRKRWHTQGSSRMSLQCHALAYVPACMKCLAALPTPCSLLLGGLPEGGLVSTQGVQGGGAEGEESGG
jgi:hypothetical protein